MSKSLSTSLVFLSKDSKIPVTSSERISNLLKRDHREIMRLVKKHLSDFNRFGVVCFENTLQKRGNKNGTQTKEIAILNEQHAYLLITFMRNFPKVVEFKVALVDEFFRMKKALNKDCMVITQKDYFEMCDHMHEKIRDEVYKQGYDEGWRARNSTASLNWQDFNDLIDSYQFLYDTRTKNLEFMRELKDVKKKLEDIQANLNMMGTGYIGTHARLLDKLKAIKTACQAK